MRDTKPEPGEPVLTAEDIRVIEFVGRGWTDERIARHLALSRTTVQRVIRRIGDRLGTRSRISLVVRAIQLGLIGIDEIKSWDLEAGESI